MSQKRWVVHHGEPWPAAVATLGYGISVCEAGGIPDDIPSEEVCEARAKLIAAAPDLLGAAKRALTFLQDSGMSHGADLARAIAKAEGRA